MNESTVNWFDVIYNYSSLIIAAALIIGIVVFVKKRKNKKISGK